MSCYRFNSDVFPDDLARSVGAVAWGVATATDIDRHVADKFDSWIAEGNHAGMTWMQRHAPLRRSPQSVLEGVRSVISFAFNYRQAVRRRSSLPQIAAYAYGRDYHDVVRSRLSLLADKITARWGGRCRVCVDSAPLPERYWAQQSGVGYQGRNCLLHVPGIGSEVVLGEILTTVAFRPGEPCTRQCPDGCRRCIDACPTGALDGNGHLDARRCLAYLTIEHRGDMPDGVDLHNCLFGCDICQRVCPHNAPPAQVTRLPEFEPTNIVLTLTCEQIQAMDEATFRRTFAGSAIRRATLAGLKRNAALLTFFEQ